MVTSNPERVSGSVAEDGAVRCKCGKKVGHVRSDGVDFFCRSCKVEVHVGIQELKLNCLMHVAKLMAAI